MDLEENSLCIPLDNDSPLRLLDKDWLSPEDLEIRSRANVRQMALRQVATPPPPGLTPNIPLQSSTNIPSSLKPSVKFNLPSSDPLPQINREPVSSQQSRAPVAPIERIHIQPSNPTSAPPGLPPSLNPLRVSKRANKGTRTTVDYIN